MRRRRSAFTLLEVLGVLALFGLLAGLVVTNSDALLPALRHDSPETALRKAFAAARRHALAAKAKTSLRFDGAGVVVRATDGTPLENFTCGAPGKTVLRLAPADGEPAALRDAPPAAGLTIPFSPAGHHAAVRIEVRDGDRARRFVTDAFSGVLSPEAAP